MHEDYVHFMMYENVRDLPPEEVLPFNVQMSGVSYCDGTYIMRRKHSNITSIAYTISGKGYLVQNDIHFTAKKGDMYILTANNDHLLYSDADDPWVFIWFNIYGDLTDRLMESYGIKNLYLVEDCDLSALFWDFYNNACTGINKLEIFNRCALIFHKIVQRLAGHTRQMSDRNSIAKMLRYEIDNLVNCRVTFDELLERVYCSKSHAIREFKKEYGITPYSYLLRKKALYAETLLKGTSLTISEIAYQLGFCDSQYFSAFFRQQTGFSPKKYRDKFNEKK